MRLAAGRRFRMQHGWFLRTLSGLLVVAAVLSRANAEGPIDVGSRKQLFIDNRFIAASEGIELRMNPATKLGALKGPDGQPYRGHVSRAVEVDGKVRLYLGAEHLQVLESEDGLQFTPREDQLPGGNFPTIFVDPHDPDPARRFKLFRGVAHIPFDPQVDGLFVSWSADGVHFGADRRVLPFFLDNPAIVSWDERIRKYVVFLRGLNLGSENQRQVARIEVDDILAPWPYSATDQDKFFLRVENVPVVLKADDEDGPHTDLYYNAATIDPEAQDVYLMFLAPFRHFAPDRQPFIRPRQPGQWEDFGLIEVQLAVSRDGIHWQRPSREPYFPTGLADEWDRWNDTMGAGIVRRGNWLYQYYSSSGRTHDSVILRPEYDHVAVQEGGVGVVRQRVDGFLSADAGHRGGWLETPPLRFDGRRLRLNIDTGATGTAFVELRDAEGRPIPGFTRDDCEEIGGNFLDQQVYWKGNPDVSALRGQTVRVFFQLTRAKLYAFTFAPH